MTTALERLLQQGRNKLPDISQYHQKQSQVAKGFNEGAAQHTNAYQQALIQKIASSKSDLVTDVKKLVDSINQVGQAREKNFEKQVRRDFRKNYSQGSDYVTRVAELTGSIDKTDSKEKSKDIPFQTDLKDSIIERNNIEKDINTLIDTSSLYDIDSVELKKPNVFDKIDRSNADIANTGFQVSLTTYAKMKNQKMYKVESKDFTGITSFQEALTEGWRMDDGSSMAEHIRREIFGDIFVQTGLNNVGSLNLRKYYYEPLSKWLDKTQTNEAIEYINEVDKNYKAEKQAELLSGLESPGSFLSGSEEDNGTSGWLYKNDSNLGLANSADKLLTQLQGLEEDELLKSSVLHKIKGADYYVKGETKPLSLKEWAKKDKRLQKLYDWVSEKAITIGSKETQNRMLADANYMNTYTNEILEDTYNKYGQNLEGYDEAAKTKDLRDYFTFLKSEQSGLSIHARQTLSPNDQIYRNLVNSIPTEQVLSDLDIQIKAEQALQNPDTELGLKNYNDMMMRIKDKSKLQNFKLSQLSFQKNGTNIAEAFKSGQGDAHKAIDEMVDKHLQETGSPLGPFIKPRAKQRFDSEYMALLKSTGSKDLALKDSLELIQKLIQNDEFDKISASSVTEPEAENINKSLAKTRHLIDNEVGIENIINYKGFYPGEIKALNEHFTNGKTYYFHELAKSYFPNVFTTDFIEQRVENLQKREWEPWEIAAFKNKYNIDLETEPFMDKERFKEVKQQVYKQVELQAKSLENKYPQVANLPLASDKIDYLDALKIEQDKKMLEALNDDSSAGEVFNYLVESGFAMEPIFESLYDKKALKGNKFNHITKNGKNWKFDEDVTSSTLSEVMGYIVNDPSPAAKFNIGIFGLTPAEIDSYIKAEDISPEDASQIVFDEEFQGKVMFHKIKDTISKNNSLSSITATSFRRLNRLPKAKKKAFVEAIKKVTIISYTGIEDQYATEDPDASIITSVWNDPQFLSTGVLDYLESQDYLKLDLSDKPESKSKRIPQQAQTGDPFLANQLFPGA